MNRTISLKIFCGCIFVFLITLYIFFDFLTAESLINQQQENRQTLSQNQLFLEYAKKGEFLFWNPYLGAGKPSGFNVNVPVNKYIPVQLLFGDSARLEVLLLIVDFLFMMLAFYYFTKYSLDTLKNAYLYALLGFFLYFNISFANYNFFYSFLNVVFIIKKTN